MPLYYWARSRKLSMSGQGHSPQPAIKTGNDYSVAVNCTESLFQLMYLRFIWQKLKLIDVIPIPTLLSISHDYGTVELYHYISHDLRINSNSNE